MTGQAPGKPPQISAGSDGDKGTPQPAAATGQDISFIPGFGSGDRGPPAVTPGQAGGSGPGQRPHPATTARPILDDLLEDPRLPWWMWRAILSAGAGAVIGLLTNWQLGVLAAAVTATADALVRLRTSAVIPASARLNSAQHRTQRRLARMAPLGYLALHSRGIPGTAFVIDHLVVGPPGVYLVASQRWDRRLPVRASNGGDLYHGPQRQTDQLARAKHMAQQASLVLGTALGQPLITRPAMVIWGPPLPWKFAELRGVDVFRGRRLRRYLRRERAARRARRLSERQIEIIHAVAAQVLPPAH